jgi:membrane protease YdiL (CAAX protease family)
LIIRKIGSFIWPIRNFIGTVWKESVIWVCALVYFNGGPGGSFMEGLPLSSIVLIVVRVGVVEELFYRGYAIERLQTLGLNRYLAAAIPLPFSLSPTGLVAGPTS